MPRRTWSWLVIEATPIYHRHFSNEIYKPKFVQKHKKHCPKQMYNILAIENPSRNFSGLAATF